MNEVLLLDTHVWLWLALVAPELSKRAKEQIRPFANADSLYISAITLFEVSYAYQRNRVTLPLPLEHWFEQVFAGPSPRIVPITTEISVASTLLPRAFHGDPADRLIAATAKAHNLILCTHDGLILRHRHAGAYQKLEV